MQAKRYRPDDPLVDAWIQHCKNYYMDSVMHLTFRQKDAKTVKAPRSYAKLKFLIRNFFSAIKFKGNYLAVMEPNASGDLHAHVLFESGSVPYAEIHDAWYHRHGIAQVYDCRERDCRSCDEDDCVWKSRNVGCSDFQYVVRKLADDGSDGGRSFDRIRPRPCA